MEKQVDGFEILLEARPLPQAVEKAKEDILAGKVTVSSISDAEPMQQRLDELFP